MLLLDLLHLVHINFTSLGLLLQFLLICLLLLLAQQFDVLDQRCNWVLLAALLLLSYTLINRIHKQHWVLDLGLNNWPQLLDQQTQAATLLL